MAGLIGNSYANRASFVEGLQGRRVLEHVSCPCLRILHVPRKKRVITVEIVDSIEHPGAAAVEVMGRNVGPEKEGLDVKRAGVCFRFGHVAVLTRNHDACRVIAAKHTAHVHAAIGEIAMEPFAVGALKRKHIVFVKRFVRQSQWIQQVSSVRLTPKDGVAYVVARAAQSGRAVKGTWDDGYVHTVIIGGNIVAWPAPHVCGIDDKSRVARRQRCQAGRFE